MGISARFVIERMEQHFGGGPWGLAPALEVATYYGTGTAGIVRRAAAGVAWRV